MVLGLVGLLACGGIAAASKAMSKSPDQPRTTVATEPKVAVDPERLERELHALRREVAGLRAAKMGQELSAVSPSAADSVPAPRPRRLTAEEIERSQTENQAQVAALASKMGTEARDPFWSRSAEQRLAEAFRAQATPGTELVSIGCRTTICGVTFRHEDPLTQRAVPHLVGAMLPYTAEMVYGYSTDGAVTTVYISREGRHLAER
jgi:hypothetical protein